MTSMHQLLILLLLQCSMMQVCSSSDCHISSSIAHLHTSCSLSPRQECHTCSKVQTDIMLYDDHATHLQLCSRTIATTCMLLLSSRSLLQHDTADLQASLQISACSMHLGPSSHRKDCHSSCFS